MENNESSSKPCELNGSADFGAGRIDTEKLLRPITADVDFIYLLVHATELGQLRSINNQIAEWARADAVVKHLDSQLTSIAFGIPDGDSNATSKRRSCIDDLATRFANHVSMIHGRRTCLVGTGTRQYLCGHRGFALLLRYDWEQ